MVFLFYIFITLLTAQGFASETCDLYEDKGYFFGTGNCSIGTALWDERPPKESDEHFVEFWLQCGVFREPSKKSRFNLKLTPNLELLNVRSQFGYHCLIGPFESKSLAIQQTIKNSNIPTSVIRAFDRSFISNGSNIRFDLFPLPSPVGSNSFGILDQDSKLFLRGSSFLWSRGDYLTSKSQCEHLNGKLANIDELVELFSYWEQNNVKIQNLVPYWITETKAVKRDGELVKVNPKSMLSTICIQTFDQSTK